MPLRAAILGLALLAVSAAGSVEARTPFDGSWSVLVITQAGDCDRAYRYEVRIENGAMRHGGQESIELTGRVHPDGRVQVTVGRGDQSASGTGRMSQTSGAGTWRGRSGQKQCSGRWEAERR